MNKNFIHTQDDKTAEKLISLGFNLIKKSGNIYTFENKKLSNFSLESKDITNCVANNILTF